MKRILTIAVFVVISIAGSSQAVSPYPEWQYSGSIFINTTPTGADLAEGKEGFDFPVLIRLNSDFFDVHF